jgi:hypothetical protein
MSRWWVPLAAFAIASCSITPVVVDDTGKSCGSGDPCGGGLVCNAGICVAPGAASSGGTRGSTGRTGATTAGADGTSGSAGGEASGGSSSAGVASSGAGTSASTGGATSTGSSAGSGTAGGSSSGGVSGTSGGDPCADAPIPDSGVLPTSRLADGGFYTYSCTLFGKTVNLYFTKQTSVETFGAEVGSGCTNFQTEDPTYECLNGESINVFTSETGQSWPYPCMYAIHNGNMGTQCTYATWLYPQ